MSEAAWEGRVSDKHLTNDCGTLNHLLAGGVVLADRGFNISESVIRAIDNMASLLHSLSVLHKFIVLVNCQQETCVGI